MHCASRTLLLLFAVLPLAKAHSQGASPSNSASQSQSQSQGASQTLTARWKVVGEASGIFGNNWLGSENATRVGGDAGFMFGIGAHQRSSQRVSAGVDVRVAIQPISIRGNGEKWNGGTLTQAELVGALSLRTPPVFSFPLSLDLRGGFAALSGVSHLTPFREASKVAPLAEGGFTLHVSRKPDAARQLAVLARYGAVRLNIDDPELSVKSGWVGRFTVGLEVSR